MTQRTQVALATDHGKQHAIAPAFVEILGWQIEVAAIDTDSWGTFTGDVPRLLSPRETAREKAQRGAVSLGLGLGVGSEGTIGPHPHVPFLTSDLEILAFVDLEEGYAVFESVLSTEIVAVSEMWSTNLSLVDLVERADLPRHALIARTVNTSPPMIHKGITTLDELKRCLSKLQEADAHAEILIESDYRAMMSPSRQAVIEQCAHKLATRLTRLCPSCSTRGWGVVDHERGVPCRGCGTLSRDAISADIEGCVRCDHRVTSLRAVSEVDPAQCQVCNP